MSYHSINLVTPMHAPGQLRPGWSCSQTLSICFSTHGSSKAAGSHLHQHPHPYKEFTVRNSQEDELLNVWRRAWEGAARQLGDSLGRAEMPSSPSAHLACFHTFSGLPQLLHPLSGPSIPGTSISKAVAGFGNGEKAQEP